VFQTGTKPIAAVEAQPTPRHRVILIQIEETLDQVWNRTNSIDEAVKCEPAKHTRGSVIGRRINDPNSDFRSPHSGAPESAGGFSRRDLGIDEYLREAKKKVHLEHDH
jgi:hypothetical protein